MSKHTITITGGSGLVGQIIRPGLKAEGHEVRVFDMYRGAAVDLLRHRFFATSRSAIALKFAHKIKHVAKKVERSLLDTPVIARRPDHILDMRSRLVDRFRGSDVVIHLAGIPHPGFRGASAPDFQTINYEGSVNVFEAAREAGVRKFVFASSAQVYMINKPTRIDQFPILETNHCPDLSEGQSHYGWLKLEFEKYMAAQCSGGPMQAVALRLEMPGLRSTFAENLYISTSVENLVAGFSLAMEAELDSGFEAFNLADGMVEPGIVDIQKYVAEKWPQVPNKTSGNECLLGIEKARRVLKYEPKSGGTYYDFFAVWD